MRVTAPNLTEYAQSIFAELGYEVVGDGEEFRAERDWKVIEVLATDQPTELPDTGSMRCFVTPSTKAKELRRKVRERDPEYEWALISVRERDNDYDYEVERAPPGPRGS